MKKGTDLFKRFLAGSLRIGGCILLAMFVMDLCGCGANDSVLRSGKETPQANAANSKPPVEQEIDSMRTAGFPFVYVLRRKDGGKIDAKDRTLIKAQTVNTNRRVATEDDKAVVIGSNFELPPENLAQLNAAFAFENYSQPPTPTNTNVNTAK